MSLGKDPHISKPERAPVPCKTGPERAAGVWGQPAGLPQGLQREQATALALSRGPSLPVYFEVSEQSAFSPYFYHLWQVISARNSVFSP